MKKRIVAILIFTTVVLLLHSVLIQASTADSDKISLRKPLPLGLRYKIGETLHYRLERQNLSFKTDGSKFGEMKALAYFTRTRLPDDEQGRVKEKFTWQSFRWEQSMTGFPAQVSNFKEAENFSLVLSVQDGAALEKLDFSRLPKTMDGVWFMIMVWDAVTFDGTTRPSKFFPFPESATVGTVIEDSQESHEFLFEYPPLITNSKYIFSGKDYSKIAGVTLVKDIPCAIVEFSQAENKVLMNLHLPVVELTSRGFEHFWGKTYLSLKDGSVVRGELVGPITLIQDIQTQVQNAPGHFEILTMGYLTLELLSEVEFKREVLEKR
jgi:hypothetical protein